MSNSIWHKANEKPELNKYVVVRKHGFAQWKVFKFDNKTTFYEPFTDDMWAYVEDIMLQADKAERLQKALCFIRNIRGAGMSYQDMFLDAHEVAKTALDPEYKPVLCGRYDEEMLDEIKQLIKGD